MESSGYRGAGSGAGRERAGLGEFGPALATPTGVAGAPETRVAEAGGHGGRGPGRPRIWTLVQLAWARGVTIGPQRRRPSLPSLGGRDALAAPDRRARGRLTACHPHPRGTARADLPPRVQSRPPGFRGGIEGWLGSRSASERAVGDPGRPGVIVTSHAEAGPLPRRLPKLVLFKHSLMLQRELV